MCWRMAAIGGTNGGKAVSEYTIEVTRIETIKVKIPDGKMTPKWLESWPNVFYAVTDSDGNENTEQAHAENLAAMAIAQQYVAQQYGNGYFFEGYGHCVLDGLYPINKVEMSGIEIVSEQDTQWFFSVER